mgnify:CR=1 FL=1
MNIHCILHTRTQHLIYGVWTSHRLQSVYEKAKEIEKKHNRYHQRFYIDNEFYHNEYKRGEGVYYRFMKRKVNDWELLEQQINDSKILYFDNVTQM